MKECVLEAKIDNIYKLADFLEEQLSKLKVSMAEDMKINLVMEELFVNIANLTLYLKAGLVFMPVVSCLYLVNGIWSLFTWYKLYRKNA